MTNTDTLLEVLANVTIKSDLLDELSVAHTTHESFVKFSKIPNLYILQHILYVLENEDPNDHNTLNHRAYRNLLYYFMLKMMTDPVWFSYLGHFMNFIPQCSVKLAPYPLKMHKRFVPDLWYRDGDTFDPMVETKKMYKPSEHFCMTRGKDETDKI